MSEKKWSFVAFLLGFIIFAVILSDKVGTEKKLMLIVLLMYGLFYLMTYSFNQYGKLIERGRFGDITCTRLKVVRDDGTDAVELSAYEDGPGGVYIYSNEANLPDEQFAHHPAAARRIMVRIGGDENGGHISVLGLGGGQASVEIDEEGGRFFVLGKDRGGASMDIHENAGRIKARQFTQYTGIFDLE